MQVSEGVLEGLAQVDSGGMGAVEVAAKAAAEAVGAGRQEDSDQEGVQGEGCASQGGNEGHSATVARQVGGGSEGGS